MPVNHLEKLSALYTVVLGSRERTEWVANKDEEPFAYLKERYREILADSIERATRGPKLPKDVHVAEFHKFEVVEILGHAHSKQMQRSLTRRASHSRKDSMDEAADFLRRHGTKISDNKKEETCSKIGKYEKKMEKRQKAGGKNKNSPKKQLQ